MSPVLSTPSSIDATRWTRALLDAAVALGGTVVTTRESDCYTSTCSYGTPSYRSYFDKEAQAWKTIAAVNDVTVHRVSWPVVRPVGASSWATPKVTTGPTVYQLVAAVGIEQSELAISLTPEQCGVAVLTIYEHDTLTPANGPLGEGIVIAKTARPSTAAALDERNNHHFVTEPDGSLRLGMFAG